MLLVAGDVIYGSDNRKRVRLRFKIIVTVPRAVKNSAMHREWLTVNHGAGSLDIRSSHARITVATTVNRFWTPTFSFTRQYHVRKRCISAWRLLSVQDTWKLMDGSHGWARRVLRCAHGNSNLVMSPSYHSHCGANASASHTTYVVFQ